MPQMLNKIIRILGVEPLTADLATHVWTYLTDALNNSATLPRQVKTLLQHNLPFSKEGKRG